MSFLADLNHAVELTEKDERIQELETDLDIARGELTSLGTEWEAQTDAIRDAIADLQGLSDVPLGEIESSIDAMISDLRKALGVL